jgi:DNA polymerase elongation subunit (family B)
MNKPLKVLFFDVETAPNIGYTWDKYETNVIEFLKERYMLCFTVKWLDENKAHTFGLPDFSEYRKDKTSDKSLVLKLWEYINEADIIVAHNGDSFDVKVMNTRFIVNGLTPPSPYKTVDTRKEARKRFGFSSNSLNDLGGVLGLGKKLSTGGFKLWKDCMEGKSDAWKKMKKYNKIDVLLLEQVYLKLRPWMKTHPNVAVCIDRTACHSCGSTNTQRRGYSYSKFTKYQRIQCTSCGSWSQGPVEK